MSRKSSRSPREAGNGADASITLSLEFDDGQLLIPLFGQFDQNLIALENRLGVYIAARGNRLTIEGRADAAAMARDVLVSLYNRLKQGSSVDLDVVDAAVSMSQPGALPEGVRSFEESAAVQIRTRLKVIQPRSPTQIRYMQHLANDNIIFALGPAGTGKTYLAVAQAVADMLAGHIQRIILSRPAVEAGERLGFLPGDMKDKVDPYLRPLYDALYDMMPGDQVERRIATGDIEIAPLAFMRGRTLSDAVVILDEAQNVTPLQMKMFLTRFGARSRMVVCGDPRQVDLGPRERSGLIDAVERLEGIDGIAVVRFSAKEVVRHPLVGRIVEAYEGSEDSADSETALEAADEGVRRTLDPARRGGVS